MYPIRPVHIIQLSSAYEKAHSNNRLLLLAFSYLQYSDKKSVEFINIPMCSLDS